MIEPSTTKLVFTPNTPPSIDALYAPLTILSNCNPVTPLAGILYKPEPSPLIKPELTENEPVTCKLFVVA